MIHQKDKYQLKNWELVSINPNKKNWSAFDLFCFWGVSVQSIIGFSLISSLYLLYDLNSLVVLLGSVIAAILIYIFANLIGKISQISGLSFPVILRLSMGFQGARYLGLVRALVGLFMFGVQTFFISKSISYLIRIIIYQLDYQINSNELFLSFFFGLNIIDWVSLIFTLGLQFFLFSKDQESLRKFIKFSALFVYLGLIIFLIIILSEQYESLSQSFALSTNFDLSIDKDQLLPLFSIVGTMFAYFAILLISFGDFSRNVKSVNDMKKGNLSLVLNLIIFSAFSILLVLGSEIILTKNAIPFDRLLTNPNDIIGKLDNTYLTFIALIFIIVSSLSTNLIANYVATQNTLINFFPNSLNLKTTGVIIAITGLIVGVLWLSFFSHRNILLIFDTLSAFFGPIFGIIIADFYLIKSQKINHKELFYPKENTEYVYTNGWNYKATYSLIIGFIFSASTMWNLSLASFQSFNFIIGALTAYLMYYFLNK